jgi:hypothetical protein
MTVLRYQLDLVLRYPLDLMGMSMMYVWIVRVAVRHSFMTMRMAVGFAQGTDSSCSC